MGAFAPGRPATTIPVPHATHGDPHDALYVGMRLISASGSTVRSGETNRVVGDS